MNIYYWFYFLITNKGVKILCVNSRGVFFKNDSTTATCSVAVKTKKKNCSIKFS